MYRPKRDGMAQTEVGALQSEHVVLRYEDLRRRLEAFKKDSDPEGTCSRLLAGSRTSVTAFTGVEIELPVKCKLERLNLNA